MIKKLRIIPFFVWLLPLFFVVHAYEAYIGFTSFKLLSSLLLIYLINSTILFLILWLIYRNRAKAGMLTICFTGIWFFFGAFHDFLKTWSPFPALYKWSVLLSGISLFLMIISIWLFRTKKDFRNLVFYLNLLLIILILADSSSIFIKNNKTKKLLWKGPSNQASGIFPDSCKKPDIYFLLFDGFSSNLGMQKFFGFDNSILDSFLLRKGFQLLPGSRSNYNKTILSMSATLNMDYNYWLDARNFLGYKEYIRATGLIKENEVMRVLRKNGYEIRNYSIFDLRDAPSPIENYFKSISTGMLSDGTFGTRFIHTFSWKFWKYPKLRKLIPFLFIQDIKGNNEFCYQATLSESSAKSSKPKFVYTHLLMPHQPFYYDREGNLNPDSITANERWHPGPDNLYTGYAQYTNKILENLVNTIQHNTGGKAVIITMGDHGYSAGIPDSVDRHLSLYNLGAIYLPDRQYGAYVKMKDSISNVNQFRILFNTLFLQKYPMMKDSFILNLDSGRGINFANSVQ